MKTIKKTKAIAGLTPRGETDLRRFSVYPLVDEDGKKHIIKTPTQLYKFLKKYDGK